MKWVFTLELKYTFETPLNEPIEVGLGSSLILDLATSRLVLPNDTSLSYESP